MRKLTLMILASAVVACDAPADMPEAPPNAQGSQGEHVPVPLTASQQQGRAIYETMCWTCHGTAGRGDGPAVQAGSVTAPPSFHSESYAGVNAETLERRFRAGLDGSDEAHPHMQYISSLLVPERFAQALSYLPALTYPPELPGSTLAGEAIYQFRCVGCHGPTGRGDGTAAASLTSAQPANFTTDTLIASKDWDAIYARIDEGGQSMHGSSMPPWGVALSESDIWDLVAYLATFQPGSLSEPSWMN